MVFLGDYSCRYFHFRETAVRYVSVCEQRGSLHNAKHTLIAQCQERYRL